MTHPNERQKQEETPRTDAERQNIWFDDLGDSFYSREMVEASFARQLEMELNDISTELRQARAEVERLKRDGERLLDTAAYLTAYHRHLMGIMDEADFVQVAHYFATDEADDEWRERQEKEIEERIDAAMAEGGVE